MCERHVETVGVAERVDVGGGGAFAEHLDDGVAGDEVDEQEDDRDDDPQDGQREEDAAGGLPESGTGHAFASLLGSAAGVAVHSLRLIRLTDFVAMVSMLTRAMRWPAISAMV